MIANVNPATGIAYGVVSMNSLAEWVFDEFFYKGESTTYQAVLADWKAENGLTGEEDDYDERLQEFNDGLQLEEEEYSLEIDGMKLELSYLGGAPLVFVLESPHVTHARRCSPCVPNAGDLDNKEEFGGVECYDLPAEWYRQDNE